MFLDPRSSPQGGRVAHALEEEDDPEARAVAGACNLCNGMKWFWFTRAICTVVRWPCGTPRGTTRPLPSNVSSTQTIQISTAHSRVTGRTSLHSP